MNAGIRYNSRRLLFISEISQIIPIAKNIRRLSDIRRENEAAARNIE